MQALSLNVRVRLSAMMFLQFFIWGAWFVTLGTYLGKGLGFGGDVIGSAYSTIPWGALIAPLFVGMIADRFFPAQVVLGICHLMGAVIIYMAASITNSTVLFWTLLGYALCYSPTLALVNAISFQQMNDPQKQFPAIRVFGTLGWIIAGLFVDYLAKIAGWFGMHDLASLNVEATAIPMKIAAASSAALGIFAFFLPNTPPKSSGKKVTVRDVFGLEALSLMKNRSFAVFVIGSLLICIPLTFYYNFTNLFLNDRGVSDAASKMTIGQMSEVLFMLIMPVFFARLGVKKMLLIGMLAWLLRYVLFAYGNAGNLVALYYLGIALHGVCYDFFFVTGHIYTNNTAPKAIQASAQGFIGVITYGVGMLIGSAISGKVVGYYQEQATRNPGSEPWKSIWLVPAAMSAVVILLFAIFFREPRAANANLSEVEDAAATLELP